MLLHMNASPPKGDALQLQQHPLLERLLTRDPDGAPGPNYAMPRQSSKGAQRPDHLPRRSRESGGRSYLPVGRHFPPGNLPYHIRKDF